MVSGAPSPSEEPRRLEGLPEDFHALVHRRFAARTARLPERRGGARPIRRIGARQGHRALGSEADYMAA